MASNSGAGGKRTLQQELKDSLDLYFPIKTAERIGTFYVSDDSASGPWPQVLACLPRAAVVATTTGTVARLSSTLARTGGTHHLLLESQDAKSAVSHGLVRLKCDDGDLAIHVLLFKWVPHRGSLGGASGTFEHALGLRFERGLEKLDRHAYAHCQITATIGSRDNNLIHKLLGDDDTEACNCVGCQLIHFQSVPAVPIAVGHGGARTSVGTFIAAVRLAIDGCVCNEHGELNTGKKDCIRCGAVLVPEGS